MIVNIARSVAEAETQLKTGIAITGEIMEEEETLSRNEVVLDQKTETTVAEITDEAAGQVDVENDKTLSE